MSWTKRQLIAQAFEEIGLAAYQYDLTPDQIYSAKRRMDAMVYGWEANGARIAYPFSATPDTDDLDTETGVPGYAVEALYLGLAVIIGPSYGKVVPQETKVAAAKAYRSMLCQVIQPIQERQLPASLPSGAGAKTGAIFLTPPTDQINAGTDGQIIHE